MSGWIQAAMQQNTISIEARSCMFTFYESASRFKRIWGIKWHEDISASYEVIFFLILTKF